MSLFDKLQAIDDTVSIDAALKLSARALEIIGKLADSANGSNAADIIMAIRHIYTAITSVAEKRTTPEEAMAELDRLEAGIRDNDAAADAAVDHKFGR